MTNQDQLKQERKIKQARYLLEDFQDATKKTKTIGIIWILLGGILLGSSLIFNAYSIPHGMVSVLGGIVIYFICDRVEWFRTINIYYAIGIYLAVVIAEFLILGLPDRIIPGFGETETEKVINFLTLINDITPLLYTGVKVALIYPFIMVLNYKNKMKSIPSVIKNKVGMKEL